MLATVFPDGKPLTSLMAYVFDADAFWMASGPGRKVDNILAEPRVSLLVDTRERGEDPVRALTVAARCDAVDGPEAADALARLRRAHPRLEAFLAAPEVVVLRARAESYLLLSADGDAEFLPMDGGDAAE